MWRNGRLMLLWGGEFASRIGESFFQIALLWYLVERTGNSLDTGIVTMISYLPAFLVGLWSGVLVDRLDYRRVMLGANLARVLLALALPLVYLLWGLPVAGIAALGFMLTSASAFFNPARDAIIPLLAGKGELVAANSLVQSAWQFSLVLGPFLAAVLLPFLPIVHLFYGVAMAFALSLLVLLGLGLKKDGLKKDGLKTDGLKADLPPEQPPVPAAAQATFWHEFTGGLGYLWGEQRVRWLWLITLVNNFFLMGPAFVGMPYYVRNYLGGTGSDFAMVEGTYAGGMIIATWLVARYGGRFSPYKLLFWGLIYDGLTYVPLLWVDTVSGTLLVILVHSLGIPIITISRITALHRIVPQAMQGRVFSYIHLAVAGMTAVSIGVVGVVLTVLPANWLFAGIGVLAASCGVFGLALPVFRPLNAAVA